LAAVIRSLGADAERCAKAGWALVELDGKNPIGHGWQRTRPLDPQSAKEIWSLRAGNMGIVLGPSGVIDFELDGGDEELYWSLVGGEWPDTPCYLTGSGKPHVLFRDPGGMSRRTRDGLELRAGPHQSVLPPSIHPDTGKAYQWVHGPEFPLMDPPPALLEFFQERTPSGAPHEGHWRDPLQSGEKLGPGEGRHQSLISFMGKAVNLFDTFEVFLGASIAYAQVTQDPPYSDREIEQWAERVWHSYREVPEDASKAEEYLQIVTADKIKMRAVEFLWKPFLQRSAFHLLVGMKGAGKGTVLAWFAAQITQGWEGERPRPVLWISTEDSFEIDVKPRFVAAGGDEKMLLTVQQNVTLPKDLPALTAVCREWDVGLVVIDPIVGAVGGVDSNSEGPIVAAIGGLNALADELDLAVIGVRHIGKNLDKGALTAVLGNVAWVNTPRAVLGMAQDDQRVVTLEVLASNRVRSGDTFDFRIEEAQVADLEGVVTKVLPKGAGNRSMEDVLAARGDKGASKVPEIKEWLLELLSDGREVAQVDLIPEVEEKFGVGKATLGRACTELKNEEHIVYIPGELDPLTGRKKEGAKWHIRLSVE
jgi:hypothetical protein